MGQIKCKRFFEIYKQCGIQIYTIPASFRPPAVECKHQRKKQ